MHFLGLKGDAWQSTAGGGDVDGLDFTLLSPAEPPSRFQNLHIIWSDLIAQSTTSAQVVLIAGPSASGKTTFARCNTSCTVEKGEQADAVDPVPWRRGAAAATDNLSSSQGPVSR
jgi:hypothetical protein